MPWRAKDVMEQRIEFVVRAVQGPEPLSGLCREYGISRPTGYLWVGRYREAGSVQGLAERSRRPQHSPGRTPPAQEERVVELRRRYGWGAKKLVVLLAREGMELPVVTVNRILKRRGLLVAEECHRPATQRFARQAPNQLWQMDFKGPWPVAEGSCYPLSMLDDHSRYLVGLHALPGTAAAGVAQALLRTFQAYGVPEAMLLDHGTPWWNPANGHGLTWLAVELIRQGIRLYYSGVRHPQTQGKVERLHRSLKHHLARRGRPRTLAESVPVLAEFRREYNQVRPHEALGMDVPAQHYKPSQRAYDPRPPEWEYEPGLWVQRLNSQGCLDYQRHRYFVCEALAEQRVGAQRIEDKLLVRYRHMWIREIDILSGRTSALVRPHHSRPVERMSG
jgi:transposase InsO family protein